jgi:ribosomal protein S12 methylthiotransferase accessory factor
MPVERWKELVSSKVGIVRDVAPQARGGDEPLPPYLYTATLSHFDFRMAERTERLAAGKGRTEQEAIAAAIAEAIERYCAYHWDPHRAFLAKWGDVQPGAISPADFVLYSERQYLSRDWRCERWKEDAEVTWIRGVELPSAQPVLAPASLVYLVHPPPRPQEFFAPASSNGLAAGPTLESAVLGGLCELMERDALLIAWMNRLPAVELELSGSGRIAAAIQRHYARFSVEVRAFLLPSDLPAAVVLALSLEDDPARPAQVVGMGCHPDPEIALNKALFELCQGRPSEAKRFSEKPPRGRLKSYSDVKTLDDHSAFASLPEQRHEFAFLWEGGAKERTGELPDRGSGDAAADLAVCAEALTRKGHRVAYVELTTPDVKGYGIHVVRSIATGLQPIHFGHGQERLGGRRLFELPQQLGLAEAVRAESDLNPCPHPLA